jgi:hypothetical protein
MRRSDAAGTISAWRLSFCLPLLAQCGLARTTVQRPASAPQRDEAARRRVTSADIFLNISWGCAALAGPPAARSITKLSRPAHASVRKKSVRAGRRGTSLAAATRAVVMRIRAEEQSRAEMCTLYPTSRLEAVLAHADGHLAESLAGPRSITCVGPGPSGGRSASTSAALTKRCRQRATPRVARRPLRSMSGGSSRTKAHQYP